MNSNPEKKMPVIIEDCWGWHWASIKGYKLDEDKGGKWMAFLPLDQYSLAADLVDIAVDEGICKIAKCSLPERAQHSRDKTIAIILFGEIDDYHFHKSCTQFMLKYNLIQRTKTGRLYNISFKLNSQTRDGVYGDDYKNEIQLKLEHIRSLDTGEWLLD